MESEDNNNSQRGLKFNAYSVLETLRTRTAGMTEKCRVTIGMHSLARHVVAILPSLTMFKFTAKPCLNLQRVLKEAHNSFRTGF